LLKLFISDANVFLGKTGNKVYCKVYFLGFPLIFQMRVEALKHAGNLAAASYVKLAHELFDIMQL